MKTLDEISKAYGTDKSSLYHNYTKLYPLYFEPLRQEPLKIFEIGIDKGYSLKTWEEYFPNADITAIDILDLKHLETPRAHIERGDQRDATFLKRIHDTYGPFDVIIDDGSHINADMKASFDCLFPLLKEGGLYIVEDLHACYWEEVLGTGKPIFIDLLKKLIDDVNSGGKSGCADIRRDSEDGWVRKKKMPEMTWWEKNIEFIHLYRSIVFIKKYPPKDEISSSPELTASFISTGNVTPVSLNRNMYVVDLAHRIKRKLTKETKKVLAKLEENYRQYEEKKKWMSPAEIIAYRKKIKIYDIFSFDNELDLLELRLNILDDAVDYFVIIEATETFSGKPKKLFFEENKKRFKKWEHKIIHYVIRDTPNDRDELRSRLHQNPNMNELDRAVLLDSLTSDLIAPASIHGFKEFYQKESIRKALVGLDDRDMCFVGNVDEIWNPHVVIDYSKDSIFKLKQLMYANFLNNRSSEAWLGTMATQYQNIKNNCLSRLRVPKGTFQIPVANGGWHFTDMGGAEMVKQKLESHGHQEHNTNAIKSNIEKQISKNKDSIGRKFSCWTDESDLPDYLLTHKSAYKTYFK